MCQQFIQFPVGYADGWFEHRLVFKGISLESLLCTRDHCSGGNGKVTSRVLRSSEIWHVSTTVRGSWRPSVTHLCRPVIFDGANQSVDFQSEQKVNEASLLCQQVIAKPVRFIPLLSRVSHRAYLNSGLLLPSLSSCSSVYFSLISSSVTFSYFLLCDQ